MPLPAWATDPSSLLITEEQYEALPSEICKSITPTCATATGIRMPPEGGKRFTLRRPDISVLRCLEPGAKLWSDDAVTAIEITSSDDEVDFNDKRAEYAAQGIPVYLIVVMDGDRIDSVEEHRLDWSGRNYQLAAVHRHSLLTELPENIKIHTSFSDVERV